MRKTLSLLLGKMSVFFCVWGVRHWHNRASHQGTYNSTLERSSDPVLPVRAIEKECKRQLCGLLPFSHRLWLEENLLPLTMDDSLIKLVTTVLLRATNKMAPL